MLNLSLEVSGETRERSLSLDTGFDRENQTWEIIVRYFGEGERLREAFPDSPIVFLQAGYLIMEVTREELERLTAMPQVIYVEMPKAMHYQLDNGRRVSCITPLQREGETAPGPGDSFGSDNAMARREGARPDAARENLTGQGVLVAILDSGIDYSHPDFRDEEGNTRIAWLWDQTLTARREEGERPPEGFVYGVEFDGETINRALAAPTLQERNAICPSRDTSGHGTHVAGIAAGNGRASEGRYRGVAYGSRLLVVKLGNVRDQGFPRTTQLMTAVTYCLRKAGQMGMPVAMNISIGNHYGSHAGDSLLETYIDEVCNQWRCNVIIGTGNEGASATHTSGNFRVNQQAELVVGAYETGVNVQLWKRYLDNVEIALETSGGEALGRMTEAGTYRFTWGNTDIYVYFGLPSPYSIYQEIFFDFIPRRTYLEEGVLYFRFTPRRLISGIYDLWLPAGGTQNRQTGFAYPTPETTLTIPSAASGAISVGAYNGRTREYAPFSGRGFTWERYQVKPDLVAPGVDITSCAPGGGYAVRSGTSMASPFVTGSAALLMEWGIVRGNDPYLYGQKMKAYLLGGTQNLHAEGLAGGETLPSEKVGWGALCAADGIPS